MCCIFIFFYSRNFYTFSWFIPCHSHHAGMGGLFSMRPFCCCFVFFNFCSFYWCCSLTLFHCGYIGCDFNSSGLWYLFWVPILCGLWIKFHGIFVIPCVLFGVWEEMFYRYLLGPFDYFFIHFLVVVVIVVFLSDHSWWELVEIQWS